MPAKCPTCEIGWLERHRVSSYREGEQQRTIATCANCRGVAWLDRAEGAWRPYAPGVIPPGVLEGAVPLLEELRRGMADYWRRYKVPRKVDPKVTREAFSFPDGPVPFDCDIPRKSFYANIPRWPNFSLTVDSGTLAVWLATDSPRGLIRERVPDRVLFDESGGFPFVELIEWAQTLVASEPPAPVEAREPVSRATVVVRGDPPRASLVCDGRTIAMDCPPVEAPEPDPDAVLALSPELLEQPRSGVAMLAEEPPESWRDRPPML